MKQIECIITAAGLSSRMGQWKLMLPWCDGTILDASIKNALQFCTRIILVTGFRGQELHQRYHRHPHITLVHNSEYEQGLFSSVRTGVDHVANEHCFITHGDLPCLHKHIFFELWQQRNEGAILPEYQGIPGHPILVATRHLQKVLHQQQSTSVRKILLQNKHQRLAMAYPEIIFDIDTPDDFMRLQTKKNACS